MAAFLCVGLYRLPAWRDLEASYWYGRCAAHAGSAGQVVHDDDPRTQAALLTTPDYVRISPGFGGAFVQRENGAWQHFAASLGSPSVTPAAFVHARTSPSGEERLVVVHFAAFPNLNRISFIASPYAGRPGGVGVSRMAARSDELHLLRTATDRVRILDGQPDPNDSSRFTIVVQINGLGHTIDGRLGDGEEVTLTPRASPYTRTFVHQWNPVVYWNPTGAPLPQDVVPSPATTSQPATTLPARE